MSTTRVFASMLHAYFKHAHLNKRFRRYSYTTAHDPSLNGTAAAQKRPALQ
jgi:hypothetical protein